jgi:hypothetical protein
LIRKAGITDRNTIYQYSLGLTTDEYRSIALTNPTTLQGWYDAAHRLFNIDSHLGNINHNTRSEWDMDVDVISVNALSREEREQHVRNNLCFICHNTYLKNVRTGSRTKEDLNQESTRGNTRKESDSQKDVIFKPQKWMTVPMKKKMSQSLAN